MSSTYSRYIPTLILVLMLCVIQGQIWLGDGSVQHIQHVHQALDEKQTANARLQAQIVRLQAEIDDLEKGHVILEGRARMELGMVKPNEIFVQITH